MDEKEKVGHVQVKNKSSHVRNFDCLPGSRFAPERTLLCPSAKIGIPVNFRLPHHSPCTVHEIAVCCHANSRGRWLAAPSRAQLRAQAVCELSGWSGGQAGPAGQSLGHRRCKRAKLTAADGRACEFDAAEAELRGSTSGARPDTIGGHAATSPPSALHIVKVLINVSVYTSSCRIEPATVCSSLLRNSRHLAISHSGTPSPPAPIDSHRLKAAQNRHVASFDTRSHQSIRMIRHRHAIARHSGPTLLAPLAIHHSQIST